MKKFTVLGRNPGNFRRNGFNSAGFLPFLNQSKCTVHMSSIYRPVNATPSSIKSSGDSGKKVKKGDESLSKSLKLLVDNGLIKQSSCFGAYHLLPFALKAMEKLVNLVDRHMMSLTNCQKIQMPTLTSASLWKTTGRLEECRPELMKIQDRHSKEFLLSPTHEEAICDLLKNPPLSYRQLPQRLYQITEKFRDEHRPRFGLLRSRQFLMKDLYTFDTTLEAAQSTYNEVNQVYQKLLNSLDLPWVQAQGSTGTIGGLLSHEFHILSELGEDSIIHCKSCKTSFNKDLLEIQEEVQVAATSGSIGTSEVISTTPKCINCGDTSSLSSSTCIEVGHSFLLGTKYTKPLQTHYVTEDNQKVPMEMGCYGLGVSRLMAASLEIKSSQDELRWPLRLAPYLVSIIPPKQGSKEESFGNQLGNKLYSVLGNFLVNDVIYDNRTNQTIGKRLQDNKKLGIPFVVVCGKAMQDLEGPRLELHDINSGTVEVETLDTIVKKLYDVNNGLKLK